MRVPRFLSKQLFIGTEYSALICVINDSRERLSVACIDPNYPDCKIKKVLRVTANNEPSVRTTEVTIDTGM